MLGDLAVDLVQELLELDRAVTAVRRADHGPIGGVERGEQACRAVPQVIVGALLRHPGHHRERRLRARQGLHLTLLIHAQNDRRLRRVQVQTDHVVDLLHEQRIGGQLERLAAVWLYPERPPDPPDRRLRQPRPRGHLAPGPVRRVLRNGLQRRDQHLLDLTAVIVAGRPGRGSSESPSNRSSQNRRRHFPTVAADTPQSRATSLFAWPSAHASTIRERNANAWEDFRRRSHRTNCSRSSSVNSNACLGRPVLAMPQH